MKIDQTANRTIINRTLSIHTIEREEETDRALTIHLLFNIRIYLNLWPINFY